MSPEEANFVSDLRAKVLANQQVGKAPHEGISPDDLQKAIQMCRADNSAAASKSKASGVAAVPSVPLDLNSLFTSKANK